MTRRRTWAAVASLGVVVATVVGTIALWSVGDRRYADNVESFARAPVGCATTLDFDRPGEFVLYIETTGEVDGLAGDCDATERYDRPADGLPRPDLTLRDPTGDDLALGPTGGVDYDTGEFVGTAYRLVEIESTGEHVLTVGSAAGEPFAVAIGREPDNGVLLWRGMAVSALATGLIALGLILVFARRRPPTVPAPEAPWVPTVGSGWPVSPPGFPAPPPTTGASGPAGPPAGSPSSSPSSSSPPLSPVSPPVPPLPTTLPTTTQPAVPPSSSPGSSPWAPPR